MIFNYRCLGCCGCSCRLGSRLLLLTPAKQEASLEAAKTTSGALLLGRCCGSRSCTAGAWCDFLDEGAFGLLSGGGFRNIIRTGDPCDPWLLLLLRCCSCIFRRFLGNQPDFFTIVIVISIICSSCLSIASWDWRGAFPRLSRCHLGRHVLKGRRHIVIGI